MSLLGCAHDSVDGAGKDTKRTAYTCLFIDERDRSRLWKTMSHIERLRAHSQQFSQPENTPLSTRRALINICQTFYNRGGVRPAASEAALTALGLWQDTVYLRYELVFYHIEPELEVGPFDVHSACPISRNRSGPR
jgi:hypothetical protein